MGVTDKSSIIIVARKVMTKHNILKIVLDKENGLQKKVDTFKINFNDLFKIGYLNFGINMVIYFLRIFIWN